MQKSSMIDNFLREKIFLIYGLTMSISGKSEEPIANMSSVRESS